MKKLFNVLLILAVFFTMPVVYAHDVETNSNIISIESTNDTIYSGSKIVVAESFGDYELYYQYVKMSDEEVTSYNDRYEDAKKYREEENPGANASDAAKKEYEDTIKNFNDYIDEVLPGYVDTEWVESTNNTAPLDLTKLPDDKETGFVLWIKAVSKENSAKEAYNDEVVFAKGQPAKEEIKDESKEENAQTGDEIIFVAIGALLLGGIMFVSLKKANS